MKLGLIVLSAGVAAAAEEDLRRNELEHAAQCAQSCDVFYCAPSPHQAAPLLATTDTVARPIPEDAFLDAANLNLDGPPQVHITSAPLFSNDECDRIIEAAEREGAGLPSTKSGKYRIGKAWVNEMPTVLEWFNAQLERKLFPMLAALFPKLVSSQSALRAHTVAILKYNASHPATDIHVDDALLAFTIALSPSSAFEGGGTFFESLGSVLPMEQGMVTIRPGAVRHAGHAVTSGLRYVLGGFIALEDRIEHVRRLNERGNRLLLEWENAGPSADAKSLEEANRLFSVAHELNPRCMLCGANRGDALLKLERHDEAEKALRGHLELVPRDADARFGLGVALRAQGRNDEAVEAYRSALELNPSDFDAWYNLGSVLAKVGRHEEEAAAYQRATELRPGEVTALINLGIARNALDDYPAAEAAFEAAAAVAPNDPRPPLNHARLLSIQSRPAEAIAKFYEASTLNAEYFDEVKLGVGTARAQQGRLAEATAAFESASRMDPKNEKLKASLVQMRKGAEELEEAAAGLEDSVDDLCGSPCQDVVDSAGYRVCAITWADGCGEAAPPTGFTASSAVWQLCERACAYYLHATGALAKRGREKGEL